MIALVIIAFISIMSSTSFRHQINNIRIMTTSNYNPINSCKSIIIMANKDGKSKKKKKDASLDSSPTTSTIQTSPITTQRVTNRINIPVRQQIAWAKAYKRLMTSQAPGGSSSSSSSQTPRKFRQLNEPRVQEEYVEVDYVNTKPPAVFVDGYNIIGHINSVEGRNIDLEDARDCLISDLSVLKGATGWWIEVVFDAYKQGGSESRMLADNIGVIFTSREDTADSYIEKRFADLRLEGFTNMVVATDDNILRMAAGSSGAGFLSASMLLEELRIAYTGWETAAASLEVESRFNRPTIADGLSDELRRAIESMRTKR